jgi:peptidyl-prolyl cis-trans isomerase SurA
MVNLGDMPANFRSTVAALAIGEASAPVRTAQGIHVFMVCDRIVPEIDVPDRRSIENNIGQTRLSMLARRYLRDLRRDAVIELR